MVHRLAKFSLPLTCACLIACAAMPAAAGAKLLVGIGDSSPAMFSEQDFLRLNLTIAREIVPWNAAVMKNKSSLHAAQAWVKAAKKDGVQPLVSFGADSGSAGNYIPSTKVYTTAIKAFIKAVPSVKQYTPWNEPDWVYRPKLADNPKLAASYFNALVANCHGCTVAAGELYLPTWRIAGSRYTLASYIRAYKRGLHYKPKAWALHNYYDVRTHTAGQLRALESLTSGQIWLTEISGLIRRGHWPYPNQSQAAAARDESFLFSLPKRFPRITRIYHYQWEGTVDTANTGWDSGLIGPLGVPRPAYYVVQKAAGLRHTTRRKIRLRR